MLLKMPKRSFLFPRCLVCSRIVWFRDSRGHQKKTIQCPKCGVQYNRAAIRDASPARWNAIRLGSLYKVKIDRIGRPILYPERLRS